MNQSRGVAVIGPDLVVEGQIRNCRHLEVHGLVKGGVTVETLHIHPGGRVFGTISAENADVRGRLEGDIKVKRLISIGEGGTVSGHVRYGQIALAPGGDLAADVRNIPPEIAGDFEIAVRRGRSARVTTADVTAIDPDDVAKNLNFAVSNPINGFIALVAAPAAAVTRFSQVDLEQGNVVFVHSGVDLSPGSFDVVVTDHSGETSGAARRVTAAVIG